MRSKSDCERERERQRSKIQLENEHKRDMEKRRCGAYEKKMVSMLWVCIRFVFVGNVGNMVDTVPERIKPLC